MSKKARRKLTPSEVASLGGKARAVKLTAERRSEIAGQGGTRAKELASPRQRTLAAKKAIAARNAKLTPEERSAIASKAGKKGGVASGLARRNRKHGK